MIDSLSGWAKDLYAKLEIQKENEQCSVGDNAVKGVNEMIGTAKAMNGKLAECEVLVKRHLLDNWPGPKEKSDLTPK